VRGTPQGGAPKKWGPEASASIASHQTHHNVLHKLDASIYLTQAGSSCITPSRNNSV